MPANQIPKCVPKQIKARKNSIKSNTDWTQCSPDNIRKTYTHARSKYTDNEICKMSVRNLRKRTLKTRKNAQNKIKNESKNFNQSGGSMHDINASDSTQRY